MRFFSNAIAAVTLFLCFSIAGYAQTTVTSGSTLSTSGAYILTGNVNHVTVTGSNIQIDLKGFTINGTSGGPTCTVSSLTVGNNCTTTPSGNNALTISGQNVTVKNGSIASGTNSGIVVNGASVRQDVTLQDLTIKDFYGDCVNITTSGVRLINVSTTQCGGYGVNSSIGANLLDNVFASNNNQWGIYLSSGVLHDVHAEYNKLGGVLALDWSTLSNSVANYNGTIGFQISGALQGLTAAGNGSDGFVINTAGSIANSIAIGNTGKGFNMATNVCYFGLASSSNTGTQIVGGTGLSGAAKCP